MEDEEMVLDMICESLRLYGFQVLEAQDGNEAMSVYKENKKPIDLVLCDVVLPQMSGKALIDRLKEMNPNIKVLFMSGYTTATIANYGILDTGANFIHKPFLLVDLVKKIRTIIEKD